MNSSVWTRVWIRINEFKRDDKQFSHLTLTYVSKRWSTRHSQWWNYFDSNFIIYLENTESGNSIIFMKNDLSIILNALNFVNLCSVKLKWYLTCCLKDFFQHFELNVNHCLSFSDVSEIFVFFIVFFEGTLLLARMTCENIFTTNMAQPCQGFASSQWQNERNVNCCAKVECDSNFYLES